MALPLAFGGASEAAMVQGGGGGPFLAPNGALYLLGRGSAHFEVWKAADPTSAWTLTDDAHAASWAGTYNAGLAGFMSGSVLYFVWQNSAGTVYHGQFNTATDLWTVNDSFAAGGAAGSGIGLAVRSNGEVVCFYGNGSAASVSYRKRPAGGAWSAATTVASGLGNGGFGIRLALGASDRIHFLWGTGAPMYHRSMSSADALDTAQNFVSDASTQPFSLPVVLTDGGGTHVRFGYQQVTTNLPRMVKFDSGANPAITVESLGATASTNAPVLTIDAATSTIYAIWQRGSDAHTVYQSSPSLGGSWSGVSDTGQSFIRLHPVVYTRGTVTAVKVFGWCQGTSASGTVAYDEVVLSTTISRTFALTQSQAASVSAQDRRTFPVSQRGGQSMVVDGSFETDALAGAPAAPWSRYLSGGAPVPTTWQVQNGWASDGTKSMRITTGNHTGSGQSVLLLQVAIPQVSVIPGATYRASADFNLLTMPVGFIARVMIEWHDAADAYLSQSYGNNLTAANLGPATSVVTAVAPANAAVGRLIVFIGGGTGVADFYVDNVTYGYAPPVIRAVSRSAALTQSQAPSLVQQARATIAASQSQAVTLAAQARRILALTQSQAFARAAQSRRILAATQPQGVAVARQAPGSFALAQGQGAATINQARRTLAVTQARALQLAAKVARTAALQQATAVDRSAVVARAVTATQGALGALVIPGSRTGVFATTQGAAATALGALARRFGATQLATVQRQTSAARSFAAGQPAAPGITRTVRATVAASQAQDASVSTRAVDVRVVSATQPMTVGLRASVARARAVTQAQLPRRGVTIARTHTRTQLALATLFRPHTQTLAAWQTQATSVRLVARLVVSTAQSQLAGSRGDGRKVLSIAQPASATLTRALTLTLLLTQSQGTVMRVPAKRGVITAEVVQSTLVGRLEHSDELAVTVERPGELVAEAI